MKKALAIILTVLLVSAMAVSVFAEYPGSPDWEYPVPTNGTLLGGEVIGNLTGWDGLETSGAGMAFDGDMETFFDPLGVGDGYCGIDAGAAYVLAEIRIAPRTTFLDRFNGATIQGSNDGEEWVDIWDNYVAAEAIDYYCVTPEDPTNGGKCEGEWYTSEAFRYFRYYNVTSHGDVGEVEFYGNPADGAAAPAAATGSASMTVDVTPIDAIASAGPFDELDAAAAAIGKTPILGCTFIEGTNGNANEGPENLWDNDVTTKFCGGEFPTVSVVALPGTYSIDGIIMATANDNSSYNNRSPYDWTILGSVDGTTWTPIASGDDTFFEETDFTYYPAAIDATTGYKYIEFYSEGALSGCFQMSELVVCGTAVAEEAPAAEAPAETDAPVAEEPAAEPAAETPTAAPVATAPATADMFIILAVVAMTALAAVVVLKKREN